MNSHVIALDVGGTSIKSAAIAPSGVVVGPVLDTAIDSQGSADLILGTLAGAITQHPAAPPPSGIAFGFPGPFDYQEGVCRIQGVEKFEALYGLNLRDAL